MVGVLAGEALVGILFAIAGVVVGDSGILVFNSFPRAVGSSDYCRFAFPSAYYFNLQGKYWYFSAPFSGWNIYFFGV